MSESGISSIPTVVGDDTSGSKTVCDSLGRMARKRRPCLTYLFLLQEEEDLLEEGVDRLGGRQRRQHDGSGDEEGPDVLTLGGGEPRRLLFGGIDHTRTCRPRGRGASIDRHR